MSPQKTLPLPGSPIKANSWFYNLWQLLQGTLKGVTQKSLYFCIKPQLLCGKNTVSGCTFLLHLSTACLCLTFSSNRCTPSICYSTHFLIQDKQATKELHKNLFNCALTLLSFFLSQSTVLKFNPYSFTNLPTFKTAFLKASIQQITKVKLFQYFLG